MFKGLRLFTTRNLSQRYFSTLQDRLSKADKGQVDLMKENLILVDEQDNKVGEISKLDGHSKENNNKYPHRAFSLFLFDANNNFIMHKRAAKKITFPSLWTNACCSHPLATPEEEEPKIGIKKAIQRRSKIELNLDVDINKMLLVDKVIYRADSDSVFEEYERKTFYFK
jgi:isopentenyl-diphosphate Delta-isomerase